MTWARPYLMFASEVDHEKYPEVEQKYRFEEVKIECEELKVIQKYICDYNELTNSEIIKLSKKLIK